jgi:hypothetical protein
MPVPDLKPVFSSNIEAVGYDNGTLYVKWNSGKISSYAGVPQDVAEKASNSWSVGSFIRQEIIPAYSHSYVQED